MSLLTKSERITVKRFARVPSLIDISPIERPSPSVSNASSFEGERDGVGVDLSEGCLVTKSLKYTHRLIHWVNAARDEGDADVIEFLVSEVLCIVPEGQGFFLNEPSNLTFLEASIYSSLDVYAFIAITASSSTLDNLLDEVQKENDMRQAIANEKGQICERNLNFELPCITNPEFTLVVLHPEHFLPNNEVLTVYGPNRKDYVIAQDRCLRESPDPSSPCLPPFHHNQSSRSKDEQVNVFLVILNAEIKFRRYFKLIQEHPPLTPLPPDVLDLMHRTVELVNLIYWKPFPEKGTEGYETLARWKANRRMERSVARSQQPLSHTRLKPLSQEIDSNDDSVSTVSSIWTLARRHADIARLLDGDLETRIANCSALMSGHNMNRDYNTSLIDGVPPPDDEHLYSKRGTVEQWQQSVR